MEGVFRTVCRTFRRRIPAVVESPFHPSRAGELHPLQHLARGLACFQVKHAHFLPVGAGSVAHLHHVTAIGRSAGQVGRDRPIVAQGIGIQEDAFLAPFFVLNEDDALVLEAIVSGQKHLFSNASRNAHARMVEQGFATFTQRLPLGQAVEVDSGRVGLGGHPCHHFRVAVVFQPAVRVRHCGAPEGVDDVDGSGFGIRHGFMRRSAARHHPRGHCHAGQGPKPKRTGRLHGIECNPTPDQLILHQSLSYPKAIHNLSP